MQILLIHDILHNQHYSDIGGILLFLLVCSDILITPVFCINVNASVGVAHSVMEDDVYNGMFIPKGATIIANSR